MMGIGLRIWEVFELSENPVLRSDGGMSFPTFPTILRSVWRGFPRKSSAILLLLVGDSLFGFVIGFVFLSDDHSVCDFYK